MEQQTYNVLGTRLECCCTEPVTGFYRDGFCQTGAADVGSHVVCAIVTDDFLLFSREQGNDLMTPVPAYGFPGLKDGDRWCLCASRWLDALEHGVAPPIVLAATHQKMLQWVELEVLQRYAVPAD